MGRSLFLVLVIATNFGCAHIVKPERQTVVFNGGASQGTTIVNAPDGKFEFTGGQGTAMMTRTKADVPIEVTCNGVTRKGVIPTQFDMFLGGLGNIIFGGIIGWIIDGSGNKGYDIKSPYNLNQLCETPQPPAQTSL